MFFYKIIIAVLIIAALNMNAQAQSYVETCTNLSLVASKIMEVRQTTDLSLSELHQRLKKREFTDDIMESLIIAAYKVSKFSTPKYQNRAIDEFENKVMIECIELTSGKN